RRAGGRQRHGGPVSGQRLADAGGGALAVSATLGRRSAAAGLCDVSSTSGLIYKRRETQSMNALFGKTCGFFIVTLMLLLGGCGEAEKAVSLEPVALHGDDECHVCGMVIADFPGPKGQAVEKAGVRKFCSTAEMLGWWLQPEN